MSKKPKVSEQTTTQNMGLPDWLDSGMQRGVKLANQARQVDTFAPFSEASQMGFEGILDQANAGGMNNAFDEWNNTLQGNYLHGGEGFDAAQQAAANRIIPQVTSAFNASGRMGGMAGQSELTSRLGDSFAGLYNNERQRQMGALSMAPTMNQLAYDPYNRALGVGAAQEAKELEELNNTRNQSSWYLDQLGKPSPFYQQQTGTQPIYSQGGGLGSVLGAGLSLAGMFAGGPAGAALGAGGGLLSSGGMGVSSTPNNAMYAPSGGGFQGWM